MRDAGPGQRSRRPATTTDPRELTERQKQCLRLLYANFSVKEIGRDLGLSPNTVHEHLRDARMKLGVGRSLVAARMLAECEGTARSAGPQPEALKDIGAMDAALPRLAWSMLQRIGLMFAAGFLALAMTGASLAGTDALGDFMLKYDIDLAN